MTARLKPLILAGCILLLGLQAIVQIRLASLDSATTDEGVHLSAGYTYLTRGDFRFNPEHPPLVKILAALPLLRLDPEVSVEAEQDWDRSGNFFFDSWRENRHFGEELLYRSGSSPDTLLFWARLPMVLLTLLLGLAIFLIAWRHWGPIPAITATALYVFNPTVTGHGHLVTTDIGLALGSLLTVYSFWQLLEQPNRRRGIYFGLAFALALLTKHTAILLLPVLLVLGVTFLVTKRTAFKPIVVPLLFGLVVTILAIWVGFGFHDRVVPASNSISSALITANKEFLPDETVAANPRVDQIYRAIRPALTILPGSYVKGLFMVVGHASGGHSSFLLGETSNTGWWYYFPVLLFLKTPLAALIILAGAVHFFLLKRKGDPLLLALGLLAGIFLLFAILAKANLGLRHIMPILPPVFLIAGWATLQSRRWQTIVLALLIWSGLVFWLTNPTYLGYYNELAGGNRNGYKIATDSNLDWGQDLKRISRFVEAQRG
jgi:4-amino-4-deoxy-L-arabinose transferase-like glycosyltransferase